ncbi:MAG: NERD domain-containing protein [Gammaproteobacteria bacterium]|nr:NERD domain-containing protein [Gammaproteobacteria bacterium]
MGEGGLAAAGQLPLVVALGVLGLLVLAGAGTWWYLRRRRSRSIPARLKQASDALLSAVLIPHVEGGYIHMEHVLLTRRGLIVLDLRDITGHVFGSEAMQEWTVLDHSRRSTFANPLPALYDRMAAVRRLVPEVPVRAVVAFTSSASFSKGYPPNVVMLDSLLVELGEMAGSCDEVPADLLASAWSRLSGAVLSPGR